MTADIFWIEHGRKGANRLESHDNLADDNRLLHRAGCVRVVTGEFGTEIRWSVFSPCFASLYYVGEWLSDLPGPFMLRYFLAGWFEESFEDVNDATRRIHDIVARGDIHLMHRVYVREIDPTGRTLPSLLQDTWIDGNATPDYSVDCVYEESSGRFRVERIGPKSTIARLWGEAPVSYPCINGGTYDRTVSAAYGDVLKSGRPRYDHVYAAMKTPDQSLMWIPYQRVIMPKHLAAGRRAVSIVTEIAKVDIRIV
jgi:hypothetical protein